MLSINGKAPTSFCVFALCVRVSSVNVLDPEDDLVALQQEDWAMLGRLVSHFSL